MTAWRRRRLLILASYLEIHKSDLSIVLRMLARQLDVSFLVSCLADNKESKALGLKVLMHIAILIPSKN